MKEVLIFGDLGSGITFDGENYYVLYDSGESCGSVMKKRIVTKSQVDRYIMNDEEAYRVLLEVDNQ